LTTERRCSTHDTSGALGEHALPIRIAVDMQLRYDETLVEAAVFLCANGRGPVVPPLQVRRFHHERERLYSILDPEARNDAFFKLHLEWFREWGLENRFSGVLSKFAILQDNLATLAIRRAQSPKEEGSELYVNEAGQRTGVLAITPRRFTTDPALPEFLRHELTHLQDMVDPAFGYSPELYLPGLNRAQEAVARERYRLLWDISIDGRLCRAGHAEPRRKESHATAFASAYSFWPVPRREQVFDALWQGAIHGHAAMLELISDPRDLHGSRQPGPGVACPLCGFPTFHWGAPDTISERVLARITAEFPDWSADRGICGRCLETYEAAVNLAGMEVSSAG